MTTVEDWLLEIKASTKITNPMGHCAWFIYEGDEVAPFEAYLRVRNDEIVVASITSYIDDNNGPGKGRLPVLIKAAMRVWPVLTFENVLNKRLHTRLKKDNFLQKGNDDCPSMTKIL